MTAVEAAPAQGDEQDRPQTDRSRNRWESPRPSPSVVVAMVIAWALVSLGPVGILWATGREGGPVADGPEAWAARDHVPLDSLPGAGLLTNGSILGFPLHWAVVAVATLALFIALAVAYNLHADARAEEHTGRSDPATPRL